MKTIRTYLNVAEAGFASSLLEAAGIDTLLAGEESFLMTPGWGTGGIRLQVADEDAERAVRLLAEGLDAAADMPFTAPEAAPPKEERAVPIGVFVASAVMFGVLLIAAHQWNENQARRVTDRLEYDYDHDGRPDHFYTYGSHFIRRTEVDRNRDGRIDFWGRFDDQGIEEAAEEDQNFDGRPDVWYSYRGGEVESWRHDTDFDGRPDWFATCEHGVIVREDCRPGDSKIAVRRYLYSAGVLREELVDENRDGTFDYRILRDAAGAQSDHIRIDPAK